jgi:hypothetical protein
MKKIEPPKILVDLYRDLRDKRLLLPFGLLAAALVLVPLALSTSSSPAPPAPTATAGAGDTPSAAQPAVLVHEVGVRNYHKRLVALKRKDPFKRHMKLPRLPGGNPGRLAKPASTVVPASGSLAPPPTSGGGSSSSLEPTTTTPPATTTESQTRTVTVERQDTSVPVYEGVVDLKVGLPTKLKKREGVKPLTDLPHSSNAVVSLLGAALDRKSATFLVSRDVSAVEGGSSCTPRRSACQLLTMKPGGKAKLTLADTGTTYVLKVLDIRLIRVGTVGGKSGLSG